SNVSEPSIAEHVAFVRVGLQIAVENPLFGVGPELYPEVFPRYRDQVLPPSQAAALAPFRVESPHDVPLAIADGAGLPALAAYLAIILLALRSGIRRWSNASGKER